MEASWRQPQTLKGLSRFLVEHEPCGAGFDVSHPAGLGSGRVSMTCRGCGATYEYATATIEFEREVEFEPVRPEEPPGDEGRTATAAAGAAYVAQPPPAEIEAPAAETPPEAAPEPEPSEAEEPTAAKAKLKRGGRREPPKRWTRDRLITAGLLLFSAAALVFAVARVVGGNDESTSQPTASPPPATSPAPQAPAEPATPARPDANPRPAPKPKPAQPEQSPVQPRPGAGERIVRADRFSVIVPQAWIERAAPGGGTLLSPPGSARVSLQIFYEDDPSLTAGKMSVQTARFLSSRDPEAAVSAAKMMRIAGDPAFEISANGPAGSQAALGIVADPYRYLAIVSADPGTPRPEREPALEAMRTLRPR